MKPEMHCPFCAGVNSIEANFCLVCGRSLREGVSLAPAQTSNAAPYSLRPISIAEPTVKPKAKPTSVKRLAIISGIALVIGLGFAKLTFTSWDHVVSAPERKVQAMAAAESIIKRGLLMTAIERSSPAAACGLRRGDIIIKYAGSPVEDITSYFDVEEMQSLNGRVSFTVFRDEKEINLTAPAGYLGFRYEDWNPARKQIYERISARDLKAAAQLAADAENERSLTEVQSLIVKIILIPNRSSEQKEQERAELLAKLLSRYPAVHLAKLGTDEFLHLRSYAAAAKCFEEHLARFNKDDVSERLNLALSYARGFEFDRADYNVHYVVDRPNPGLSKHGVLVAHQAAGLIALGRNKYREALDHFLPYLEGGDDYTMLMCLLASAKLGDLDKFNEIRTRAIAVSADGVKRQGFDVDTLNAYVLSEKGKRTEAAAMVLKWGNAHCVVETSAAYWDEIPGGTGISDRMRSLVNSD
jgi:hypothetical protein